MVIIGFRSKNIIIVETKLLTHVSQHKTNYQIT